MERPQSKAQLWSSAVHEAAHAVVAVHERVEFSCVVLRREGRTNGMLRDVLFDPTDDACVRVMLAGVMAHRLRVGRWDNRAFDCADDDMRMVGDFYRDKPSTNVDVLLPWNIEATHTRLRDEWASVELVATRLYERRQVMHDEVVQSVRAPPARVLPRGRLDKTGWRRLLDHIRFRIRCEGSMSEIFDALLSKRIDRV